MHNNGLARDCLQAFRRLDTCTVSNAIERLDVRPRNEGFIHGLINCRFPDFPPVVGYAAVGRIRSSMMPVRGRCYHENMAFWRYLESVPAPRIVVLKDCDDSPGLGALFGEIHVHICKALDCVAYVTNGSVRYLPSIEAMGFQLFSGSVALSHAYAHVVDFGDPIELGGLRISSGDLLHGDLHGVQNIPLEIASKLPAIAQELLAERQEFFRFCQRKDFSLDALESRFNQGVPKEVCE